MATTNPRKRSPVQRNATPRPATARPRKRVSSPPVSKPLCFVISPFGGWFDVYYAQVFKPAIEDAGLQAARVDEKQLPTIIVEDIWAFIKDSTLVLADLTNLNANVFYELGLAHAAKKPVIQITQHDLATVPFDLAAIRTKRYDTNDPQWGPSLRADLAEMIRQVVAHPEDAIRRIFLDSPAAQPLVADSRLDRVEERIESLRVQVSKLMYEISATPYATIFASSLPSPQDIGVYRPLGSYTFLQSSEPIPPASDRTARERESPEEGAAEPK